MNEIVEVRMASWQAMVQNSHVSGLSMKDWCTANKVSESQYYYRLRQLRNAALVAASQMPKLNAGGFTQIPLRPFQKNVILLFRGTRSDWFKGLLWEGDGFYLVYKRIEACRLRWPRSR